MTNYKATNIPGRFSQRVGWIGALSGSAARVGGAALMGSDVGRAGRNALRERSGRGPSAAKARRHIIRGVFPPPDVLALRWKVGNGDWCASGFIRLLGAPRYQRVSYSEWGLFGKRDGAMCDQSRPRMVAVGGASGARVGDGEGRESHTVESVRNGKGVADKGVMHFRDPVPSGGGGTWISEGCMAWWLCGGNTA